MKCFLCLGGFEGEGTTGVISSCGHCLDTYCYYKLYRYRDEHFREYDDECPICGIKVDNFVPLFLDFHTLTTKSNTETTHTKDCMEVFTKPVKKLPILEGTTTGILDCNSLQKCSICLKGLEGDETTGALDYCGHCFHVCCLEELQEYNNENNFKDRCPICREYFDEIIPLFLDYTTHTNSANTQTTHTRSRRELISFIESMFPDLEDEHWPPF